MKYQSSRGTYQGRLWTAPCHTTVYQRCSSSTCYDLKNEAGITFSPNVSMVSTMSKLVSQKQSTLCWRWGTSTEKSRLPWTQSYLLSLQVISTNSSSCSCSHKSGLHSQMKAVSVFLCSTAHFSSHRTASLNLRPSHFLFPQILPMVTQLNSEERLPNN